MLWKTWKKGFKKWESITADYIEKILKNPAVLYPSGKMLEAAMKTKSTADDAAETLWGSWGLPTKHDQERALHRLNQLESRILDLEEQIRQLDDDSE